MENDHNDQFLKETEGEKIADINSSIVNEYDLDLEDETLETDEMVIKDDKEDVKDNEDDDEEEYDLDLEDEDDYEPDIPDEELYEDDDF